MSRNPKRNFYGEFYIFSELSDDGEHRWYVGRMGLGKLEGPFKRRDSAQRVARKYYSMMEISRIVYDTVEARY